MVRSFGILIVCSAGLFDPSVECTGRCEAQGLVRVRVTHRFHPLFGGEFEFVKRRRNWAADRVYVFDGDGELLSLPLEWTDLASHDPFVVVAAGRSPFRTQDLLELADLVGVLTDGCAGRPVGERTAVERITP